METIGFYGTDEEEQEMFCLLCSTVDGLAVDVDNPITDNGYPDGFMCCECWGCVLGDGSVENRVGETK
jgi:hypothetical protein